MQALSTARGGALSAPNSQVGISVGRSGGGMLVGVGDAKQLQTGTGQQMQSFTVGQSGQAPVRQAVYSKLAAPPLLQAGTEHQVQCGQVLVALPSNKTLCELPPNTAAVVPVELPAPWTVTSRKSHYQKKKVPVAQLATSSFAKAEAACQPIGDSISAIGGQTASGLGKSGWFNPR